VRSGCIMWTLFNRHACCARKAARERFLYNGRIVKRKVRWKVFAVCIVLGLVLVGMPVQAQVMPVPRSTEPGFAAVAQAQLETIHYMAHVFLARNGVYPESLQELRDSPYWVVNILNQYTGLPIRQIPFIPHDEDFAVAEALPGGGAFGAVEEESPEPRTGQVIEDEDGARRVTTAGRRIDPARVQFPSPGDILYYGDMDSLQLVMYDNTGAWQELWIELPFNYRAANLRVVKSARPRSDFLVAETATHLELLLPGMYNRYLFLTDRPTLTPEGLEEKLTWHFEKIACELSLQYLNRVKNRPFMRADYYSPGDMAAAAWLDEDGRFYFLDGKRARSLLELTDEGALRENSDAVKRRDKLVARHADDVPTKSG